jgi:hypothetical protein
LTALRLDGNQLTSIPPEIGQLTNLTDLSLDCNQLTSIPPEIGQLTNLTALLIHTNQLTSIPPEIGQLTNLTALRLDGNQLTSIPPVIGQLTNLTALRLDGNQLTSIPPEIGQLTNLITLTICRNEITHIPANVTRLLNRQMTAQGIYNDTQSVHNSNIQKTIKESILRLLKERVVLDDVLSSILSDVVLSPFTKESLIEYSKDESVHTELNLSFSDLLTIVWNRVISSPQSEEIKAVLNTEMEDAACKCFTGRISRLVNCLNGFDPLVRVQIADNEQIGNIISLVKVHLEDKNEYTIERHKEVAKERLKELGVEETDIDAWLEYIE